MRVPRRDPKTVIDHHESSVARVVLGNRHDAICRRVNGRAVIGRDVNTSMERALTAERILPFPEAIRDVPEGVYVESAKLIDGIKRMPPLDTAITAAFRFKKVYCSTERSNISSGVTGLSL